LPQNKIDHGKDGLFNVNTQTKPEARHLN
jgi:hypothetical protein